MATENYNSVKKIIEMDLDLEAVEISEVANVTSFLLITLQLVADKDGDPHKIYPVWQNQQENFSPNLLKSIPRLIEKLFSENSNKKLLMAAILIDFADLIYQFPLGIPWVNVELGIVVYELTLTVYTFDLFPKQWAAIQNNLANAYSDRILGNRSDNIKEAIEAYEKALQVRTYESAPLDWAITQNNLALALSNCSLGTKGNNIERAIKAYESVLLVYTLETDPDLWSTAHNNLALAFGKRIMGNRSENIEKAIESLQLSLTVRTRDKSPKKWATTHQNLASAYSYRLLGSRANNIEDAIISYQLALEILTCESFPVDWATVQNNLGAAYFIRIKGDRAINIEMAITAYEMAEQIRTSEALPLDWAVTQNNLANAYSERILGDRSENLEKAIVAYEKALQVRTRESNPEQWGMTQHNLAAAHHKRIQGDRSENLEKAIDAYEKALQVRTYESTPLDWAMTQSNLAVAYMDRIQGDRSENLEKAIDAYKKVLQVRTHKTAPVDWAMTQNNLANVYKDRLQGSQTKNLGKAIDAYQHALQILTSDTFPRECRQTSRLLADLQNDCGNHSGAAQAYTIAISANNNLYQSCLVIDSKNAELRESNDLHRRAAYTYSKNNNLRKSLEVLEQGRARGLSASLDRDRTNLDSLQQQNPDLYNQYKEITQQLRNLEAIERNRTVSSDLDILTPETLHNEAISLHKKLTITLDQIRKQSGYKTFLTLPTDEDVRHASTPECHLVYLLTTSAGSLALIITPDAIHHVWLDEFTEAQLTELLQTWFGAYNNANQDRQTWLDTIDQTTQHLWNPLMGPLVQKLQGLGCDRIALIPTGYLSLLPLHAAWIEDESKPSKRRYAFDDIHITYAPNAKSLTAAQVIADRVISLDSILAIDNPRKDLPNSEREINCAIATFPQPSILRHEKATIASVQEGLVGAAIVHFSCHGTANLKEPLNSGLAMSDGLLTLKDIFALNLAESGGIRLAILSACETGIQGIENADEAISLPTGLLQAGVAAVIASLWSVSDLSTMLLLTRFYDLWRIDGLPPSVALLQAQQWVRDTTNQEKYNYLKNHFQALARTQQISEQEVNNLLRDFMIQYIYQDGSESRSFAHPFHWAAFSYVGV